MSTNYFPPALPQLLPSRIVNFILINLFLALAAPLDSVIVTRDTSRHALKTLEFQQLEQVKDVNHSTKTVRSPSHSFEPVRSLPFEVST